MKMMVGVYRRRRASAEGMKNIDCIQANIHGWQPAS
jgi:hypothetical protein